MKSILKNSKKKYSKNKQNSMKNKCKKPSS